MHSDEVHNVLSELEGTSGAGAKCVKVIPECLSHSRPQGIQLVYYR